MADPFRIFVPDAVLDDLRARLAQTRWPSALEGAGWAYGTDPDYLRELMDYWREGYDWRAREARLNELPHFRAPIDDCFRLAGLLRKHWRGLSGGTEVWKQMAQFFTELRQRAEERHV